LKLKDQIKPNLTLAWSSHNKSSLYLSSTSDDIYIIVTDMEDNISFTVCTTTQGQSVYPDIVLHISNYCAYCIEDQNLTHTM